jgi:predicted Zn-dependent protease
MRPLSVFLSVLLTTILSIAAVLPADALQSGWRQRKTAGLQSVPTKDDVREEMRFGREVAARIIGRYGLYDRADLMRYVNLVGASVAMNTDRQELEFHFAVLNTDEINAYAAPGGYVFVTRGALSKMQDEAELAGVLAHEISHITGMHIVKELSIKGTEDSTAAGFARVIGGTTEAARTAFSQAVDKALDVLFKDGYRREDEVQADKTAASYTALAGYDPSGLARYLQRIGPIKEKTTEVLDKTHPAFTERVAWLRATIQEEGMETKGARVARQRFEDMAKKIK